MDALKYYDFTLTANGSQVLLVSGNNFRIQSQTGAVDVTVDSVGTLPGLLTGQGLKDVPFQRLTLRDASGAPNVGTILVSPAEFVDNRTYGVMTLGSAVALDAATVAELNLITPPNQPNGAYAVSNLAMAAVTPEVVFSVAANVNGAILLSGSIVGSDATNTQVALMHAAAPPGTMTAGSVIMQALMTSTSFSTALLQYPQFIPAGHGLYFIADQISGASRLNARAARYLML